MYFLCKYFAGLLLWLTVSGPAIAQPDQLTTLLAEADSQNPSLKITQEQIEVASSQIAQVTSLPDRIL